VEIGRASEAEIESTSRKRGSRGLTKAKILPLTNHDQIKVEYNDIDVPTGQGSVYLSSFLGLLVRELVSYALDDWRNLCDELKFVL